MLHGLGRHGAALGLGLQKVLLDIPDAGASPEEGAALKMVIEAAVIQVDGAHGGLPVVGHEDFGMDKTRRVLVDPHPGGQQASVVGLGQSVGQALVRDAGKDEAYVYAPLGGEFQRRLHLLVQDQIGGHDVHIVPCPVQNVQIHPFAHPFPVQGTVGIGHDEARCPGAALRRRVQSLPALQPARLQVPHLQEHQREAAHRLAPQQHAAVLPVAEAAHLVDILIRQVHAAGEGHLPVDHQDLPVVPVVVVGGHKGHHRREGLGPDAQLFQAPGIVPGQGEELVGAVIEHPHVHPRGGLAGQDLQDPAPHLPFRNHEKLQKDEVLRLFQLLQQGREQFVPQGIVAHLGLFTHREAAGTVHIAGDALHLRRLVGEAHQSIHRLGQAVPGLAGDGGIAIPQDPVADLALGVDVEKPAEDRQQQDHQQPGELGVGLPPAVDEEEAHGPGEDQRKGIVMGHEVLQIAEALDQQQDLQQQKKRDHACPAEHRPPQAPTALFQQTQPPGIRFQTDLVLHAFLRFLPP